ncbi:FAD-dependent monooxygenase [Allokutzneria albata]|uniref:2-polyprenyl-6-methoxyphenol hydroxylase n=1 Tax=Allokutzneria albata TaxID=211114 RepID=A0A1G9TGS6_ALLAB|nr:FAD-dependent monooxygenase [Allokutzneria albata]SDM46951.1 2-polyprenyl-6-methoxyphenol hydroxylase [Allokutzneria albata]
MILIAGAGPTGLTLAIDLARRGVAVRVVDKAERHFVGSRGKGLQPRTLEVLADLGVLDAVRAAGSPYPLLRMHGPDGHTDRSMFEPGGAEPWMLGQGELEAILRTALAEHGVQVELAAELTGFTQDDDGVTAVVNGTEIRADHLIGADGGHSFVRKHLGLAFVGHPVDELKMVIADITSRGLERDRWHLWPQALPTMIGMCPLPGGVDRFQLTMGITDEPDEITEDYLRAALHERTGRTDVTVSDPTWTSTYRSNARMVDRYRVGRVLLAGDAAHVHPPTGGQGLNTGVQDAYNLGWKLAAVLNGASEALLDTYEEERLPIAAGVLGLSTDLLGKSIRKEEAGFKRGKETQQLHLSYRGSSLARGERGGDHVPGVFGPDFTLLTPEQCEPYSCTFVLVRPDGYIAISTDDLDDVRDYLRHLRLPLRPLATARGEASLGG